LEKRFFEQGNEVSISFDGDDDGLALEQRTGQCTGSCPDFENGSSWLRHTMLGNASGDVLVCEKALTEGTLGVESSVAKTLSCRQ
jgi:hypothetical protein